MIADLPKEYRTARLESLPEGLQSIAEATIRKKFNLQKDQPKKPSPWNNKYKQVNRFEQEDMPKPGGYIRYSGINAPMRDTRSLFDIGWDNALRSIDGIPAYPKANLMVSMAIPETGFHKGMTCSVGYNQTAFDALSVIRRGLYEEYLKKSTGNLRVIFHIDVLR